MIILRRAQIGKSEGLDVTVKSAPEWLMPLTPTWHMVWAHKQGRMTDAEYEKSYYQILDRIPMHVITKLVEYARGHSNQITFLCYCRNGAFCHTYLLCSYLARNYSDLFENAT